MRGAISALSRYELEVHVCEEIPGGKDWRKWINENISRSKILIFLYTQEIADWGWCLYEIGLFQGQRLQETVGVDKYHMICIKNPNIIPLSPIENFQAYDADEQGIKKFFDNLLVNGKFTDTACYIRITDDPDNKYKQAERAIKDLARFFSLPKTESEYYIKRLVFELNKQSEQSDNSTTVEIDNAMISGDQVTMEEILDLSSSNVSWQQLYEQFRGKRALWYLAG